MHCTEKLFFVTILHLQSKLLLATLASLNLCSNSCCLTLLLPPIVIISTLQFGGVSAQFWVIGGLHAKLGILGKHLMDRPAIGVSTTSTSTTTADSTNSSIIKASVSTITLLGNP